MGETLNHFDEHGNAIMVDVTEKDITERIAIASGKIYMKQDTFHTICSQTAKKGDVLGVARVAGIMASKKTGDLIPMCHPLMLTKVAIDYEFSQNKDWIKTIATAKLCGKTGVEMEALTAVSVTLLTIYDMCKAIDRSMEIGELHLKEKIGGKSGHFKRNS